MTRRVGQEGIPSHAVRVRTVRPEEGLRWNRLMRERHYPGFRSFSGNRLRQVAVLGEHWACEFATGRIRPRPHSPCLPHLGPSNQKARSSGNLGGLENSPDVPETPS